MTEALIKAWEEVLRPFLLRPKRVQVAALCTRLSGPDKEVLLITSRGTGRWIVPKGWPIDGLNGPETALQEAWEEAGVQGTQAASKPVGRYSYNKIKDSGLAVPVETEVYQIHVSTLADDYPEVGQRKRMWVSPDTAANLVREPQLKAILRDL